MKSLFKSRPRKAKLNYNVVCSRDRFPYYKSNDDRWKNSVRHNLSINPHFRKGNKAKAGAGHLWKISSRESEANFLAWEHVSRQDNDPLNPHLISTILTQKKQRLELFFKMEAANQLKRQEASRKESMDTGINKNIESLSSPSYDAELNAATASIISLPVVDTSSPIISAHGDVSFNESYFINFFESKISFISSESLLKTRISSQISSSPTQIQPNCTNSMKFFR